MRPGRADVDVDDKEEGDNNRRRAAGRSYESEIHSFFLIDTCAPLCVRMVASSRLILFLRGRVPNFIQEGATSSSSSPPPLPPPAAPTRQAFHRHRTSCRVIATGTNRFPLSSSAPDRLVAYFEVGVTSTTPDCDGCPRPLLFM